MHKYFLYSTVNFHIVLQGSFLLNKTKVESFFRNIRIPLKQSVSEMKMDSWGLYTVTVKTVVHDDDVTTPYQEYVCTLSIPSANYTISKTTVYYPGTVNKYKQYLISNILKVI